MRHKLPVVTTLAMFAFAPAAGAVTLTNLDGNSVQILVCDENCPSDDEYWGSAFDFWLAPGETKTFACSGECFVGSYYDGHSPTLGDMAVADDDEMFSGDEHGYIQNGFAVHTPK
ncbi:MAG: hypothetical protein CVT81_05625 [Alphaproteobacteria bacterium HGW-Alphaproteobacteria-3]|nr:MAG: hypothetical protein CVT81_05625 [Alphaproteobacteria bacterium HGW-Alphaproteobacteria-3]